MVRCRNVGGGVPCRCCPGGGLVQHVAARDDGDAAGVAGQDGAFAGAGPPATHLHVGFLIALPDRRGEEFVHHFPPLPLPPAAVVVLVVVVVLRRGQGAVHAVQRRSSRAVLWLRKRGNGNGEAVRLTGRLVQSDGRRLRDNSVVGKSGRDERSGGGEW